MGNITNCCEPTTIGNLPSSQNSKQEDQQDCQSNLVKDDNHEKEHGPKKEKARYELKEVSDLLTKYISSIEHKTVKEGFFKKVEQLKLSEKPISPYLYVNCQNHKEIIEVYCGNYRNEQRFGLGCGINMIHNEIYIGEWDNDTINGSGMIIILPPGIANEKGEVASQICISGNFDENGPKDYCTVHNGFDTKDAFFVDGVDIKSSD